MNHSQPLCVGIGGPVGSGKTALTLTLCQALRGRFQIAVVTNDIYTQEDSQFLVRHEALAPERARMFDSHTMQSVSWVPLLLQAP